MKQDLVTVIIPVYNVEKYLDECIISIINQTYSNLEILLIDDGSTDNSKIMCDNYQRQDKRIEVIHKNNGGVSSARNIGLNNAKGKWITFIDPDDWAEKNMIERAVNVALEHEADIVQWNSYYNKENGEQSKRKDIFPNFIKRKGKEIELFELDVISRIYEEKTNKVSVGPIGGVWGKLFKKSILDDIRFNESLYAFEDGIFDLYAFEKSNVVVLFNEFLHHYRIIHKSACNSFKKDWLEQNEKILEEVDKFIKTKDKDKIFSELYNSLACELFSSCLTRYFFHPDNNKSKKEIIEELKNYIYIKEHKEIWKNVNFKYLNNKQKIIIWFAKIGKPKLIRQVYLLKQKIGS